MLSHQSARRITSQFNSLSHLKIINAGIRKFNYNFHERVPDVFRPEKEEFLCKRDLETFSLTDDNIVSNLSKPNHQNVKKKKSPGRPRGSKLKTTTTTPTDENIVSNLSQPNHQNVKKKKSPGRPRGSKLKTTTTTPTDENVVSNLSQPNNQNVKKKKSPGRPRGSKLKTTTTIPTDIEETKDRKISSKNTPTKRGRKPKLLDKESESLQKSINNTENDLEPVIKRSLKKKTITKNEYKRTVKISEQIQRRVEAKCDMTHASDSSNSMSTIDLESKSQLVEYLSHAHNAKDSFLPENRKLDVTNRVDIVDSKLCDDALERLAPTLENYKGCDIIDLNPGASIWSSKLHDLLQPRSHILVEPHPSTYMPNLSKLLDAPNSKYRLVPKNGTSWDHLEKILGPEYLPCQQCFKPGDPRSDELNTTLLVVANIAAHHPRRFFKFHSLATVVIYQFLSAMRTRALFQQFGKVRMLIWMNPTDAKLMPRSVANRKKTSLEALVSCEHVEIIVDPDELEHYGREKKLDIQRVSSVIKKMEENGVRIPEGRETFLLDNMRAGKTGLEIEELCPMNLQNELQKLEEAYSKGQFEKDLFDSDGYHISRNRLTKKTPEYLRMCELNRRYHRRISKTNNLSKLADNFDDIQALYKESHLTPDPAAQKKILEKIDTLTQNWKKRLESLSPVDSAELQYICDNRRTFNQTPPGLFWDRREAEPMKSYKNEFYPQRALSLFDFRPRVMPTASQDPSFHDVLSFIITQFCLTPSQSLKQTLKSLAPGAMEFLISECPSLTDPLKNGCPDLDLFTARCVTSEMLFEMCEAWLKWPFKPDRHETLYRLGSDVFTQETE